MSEPVLYKDATETRNTDYVINPSEAKSGCKPTWDRRESEPPYAKLSDPVSKKSNRYGQRIDLLDISDQPEGRSMFINENPVVGDNPNRNKQHGFFFTADNCIGCHACEAACSEKNDNPAHLAFRSVGYVEGGSYPDYKRMNISMACNHCDDPVCLKGCPTRAYTKHAEYGAVLQDPETCFGCGYCTWVCPYNAPQLDPVKGQVSKCNMCVDRLEVGLKPACVSACVGNALDFGVIENIPENREQAKASIPGFPDPSITQPNIRFQQIKDLPETMTRTDSAPVKYHRDASGDFKPMVDQKKGKARHWSLSKLSSRENPLVIFTLAAQASVGAVTMLTAGELLGVASFVQFTSSIIYSPLLVVCLLLIGLGLFMSTLHLGKPLRFYRGFNNLRHSPVCREGLGIALFMTFLAGQIVFSLLDNFVFTSLWTSLFEFPVTDLIAPSFSDSIATTMKVLAVVSGFVGIYYMNRCYRIKARPFWNHWQVASSFFGNLLSLGALIAGAAMVGVQAFNGQDYQSTLSIFTTLFVTGLALESFGLFVHGRAMSAAEHEGAASHYVQLTTFGKSYFLRNALLLVSLIFATSLLIIQPTGALALIYWLVISASVLLSSLIGRALFYVLVIPTTMPGAFFWKNKGFEEHARDIGLAKMEQVGVK